jgi:tRNA U34 5-methylaminomethyl-2-thiouridine-forming methyltransferase MnmC
MRLPTVRSRRRRTYSWAATILPQRWAAAQRFVIVETGFGAGVNFLATWDAWLRSAPAGARLHYISVEKHPFLRNDLARVLARSVTLRIAGGAIAGSNIRCPYLAFIV